MHYHLIEKKSERIQLRPSKMVSLKRSRRSASPEGNGKAKRLKSTSSSVLHAYSRLQDINEYPSAKSQPMSIFVWGTGSMCELGLGPAAATKEVKRPRLNPYLTKGRLDGASIVDFAVGGMHVLALDDRNRLWSWGTNDNLALGRDTSKVKEVLKSIEASTSDDDDEDGDLNESESTPGLVENLPTGAAKIVQLVATDNLSAILLSDGSVYAWGTFRCNEGILGFSKECEIQARPMKVKSVENVVQIAGGKDHILALDKKGIVYAWGNGQHFQLGRKILERHRLSALEPHAFGLYNIKYIASGDFHCFAIDTENRVFSWGLNQFGQCGVTDENGDLEDGSLLSQPTEVPELTQLHIKAIAAGEHHTLALTHSGDVFAWGRYDMKEVGISRAELPSWTFYDTHGQPRSVPKPFKLKISTDSNLKMKAIAVGSHHSFAVTEDGVVYAWGFGDTYAPGLGPLDGDVEVPTRIYNTATKNMNIQMIAGGGQFSVSGGIEITNADEAERRLEKYEDIDN